MEWWSPLRVGIAVVVTAIIYTGEWLLSVPAWDALVDATLGGFVARRRVRPRASPPAASELSESSSSGTGGKVSANLMAFIAEVSRSGTPEERCRAMCSRRPSFAMWNSMTSSPSIPRSPA